MAKSTPPPEVKESIAFRFFADSLSEGVGTLSREEDPAILVKKYGHSTTWVFIAVNRLGTSCAQIPIQVLDQRRMTDPNQPNAQVKPTHPLARLLAKPNPYESGEEFQESVVQSLACTGNAYVEKVSAGKTGPPEELYLLPTQYTRVKPDPKKKVAGYIFCANGQEVVIPPEKICHIKLPNPANPYVGLAPMSAAKRAIDIDTFSLDWNTNFLQRGGWPGGSIETDQPLLPDVAKKVERMVKRHLSRGKDRAGEVMFLTHGMKYKAHVVAPKDLEWMDARRMSRDEILAVFGVPFAVAGLFSTEQTTARSAGVEQQIKQFYRNTVSGYLNRILSAYNRDFVSSFGDLVLVPDLRRVPALQDDVQTDFVRSQALRLLTSAGVPLNAAVAYLFPHAGWPKFAWGDVWWTSQTTVPITGPTDNAGTRTDVAPDTPDPDAPADVATMNAIRARLHRVRTLRGRLKS